MSSPIAHASIAIMGKSISKKNPLWLLLIATQVPDLMIFLFQLIGLEYQAETIIDFVNGWTYLKPAHIPWSHGMFMCIVYSIVMASVVFLFYRRFRISFIAGLMVMSHWLLDFIVYDNLPLFFKDTPTVGLGFVKSPVGVKIAIAIEVISVIAVLIYGIKYFLQKKRAKKPTLQEGISND
jgi:hypothetical protein